MLNNLFLTVVAILYGFLAIWCTLDPQTTSQKVGFDLKPGSGPNEFVTVYGGLEMAIALLLLMCWVSPSASFHALLACTIIHACLVIFRSYAFLTLPWEGIEGLTYRLAIGEWVLFLASASLLAYQFLSPAGDSAV